MIRIAQVAHQNKQFILLDSVPCSNRSAKIFSVEQYYTLFCLSLSFLLPKDLIFRWRL